MIMTVIIIIIIIYINRIIIIIFSVKRFWSAYVNSAM